MNDERILVQILETLILSFNKTGVLHDSNNPSIYH